MITAADVHDFSDTELAQLNAALRMANAVLNDGDFGPMVLRHARKDGSAGFDDTVDTPDKVLANIRTSYDKGIALHFKIMNQTIKMWFNHTVAEEKGGGVVFNRTRYATESLPALTNTVVHETMHAVGYHHDHKSLYPWTVPYGVGHIAEQLAISLSAPDAA